MHMYIRSVGRIQRRVVNRLWAFGQPKNTFALSGVNLTYVVGMVMFSKRSEEIDSSVTAMSKSTIRPIHGFKLFRF